MSEDLRKSIVVMKSTISTLKEHVDTICSARNELSSDFDVVIRYAQKQAAEIDRLTAFIEELRDYKPEIHSGRMADPQDDVPDVIEADVFLTFQEDAKAALEAKT